MAVSENVLISDTTEDTGKRCIFTNWTATQSVYICLSQPDSPLSIYNSLSNCCKCVLKCVTQQHTLTFTHPNVSLAGRSEGVCVWVSAWECMTVLVKVEIFENCSVSSCDSAQIWFTRCCVVSSATRSSLGLFLSTCTPDCGIYSSPNKRLYPHRQKRTTIVAMLATVFVPFVSAFKLGWEHSRASEHMCVCFCAVMFFFTVLICCSESICSLYRRARPVYCSGL